MDDTNRQLDGGSDDEMAVSPRNSGDSEDSGQGNPANQGLASVGQGASEYQESPSGISAGTSSTKRSTARESCSSKIDDVKEVNIPEENRSTASTSCSSNSGDVKEVNIPAGKRSTARKSCSSQSRDIKEVNIPAGKRSTARKSFPSKSGDVKEVNIPSGKRSTARKSFPSTRGERSSSAEEKIGAKENESIPAKKISSSSEESSGEESSGEESSGEEFSGEEPSEAFVEITKYAYNARVLLLTILEEVMQRSEEMKFYEEFCNSFDSLSESPDLKYYLAEDLLVYVEQMTTAFDVRHSFSASDDRECMEYLASKRYTSLAKLVVRTLIHTVSRWQGEKTSIIMRKYESLKNKYKKFSDYWRAHEATISEKCESDESDINRVKSDKQITERLLLQTRNAFRELLLNIGEYDVEQTLMDEYEGKLFPEDISFLRRQII